MASTRLRLSCARPASSGSAQPRMEKGTEPSSSTAGVVAWEMAAWAGESRAQVSRMCFNGMCSDGRPVSSTHSEAPAHARSPHLTATRNHSPSRDGTHGWG